MIRHLKIMQIFQGLIFQRKEVLDPNNVFAFEKLNSIKWSANSENLAFYE